MQFDPDRIPSSLSLHMNVNSISSQSIRTWWEAGSFGGPTDANPRPSSLALAPKATVKKSGPQKTA